MDVAGPAQSTIHAPRGGPCPSWRVPRITVLWRLRNGVVVLGAVVQYGPAGAELGLRASDPDFARPVPPFA